MTHLKIQAIACISLFVTLAVIPVRAGLQSGCNGKTLILSCRPAIDIPIGIDRNVFKTSGGLELSAIKPLPRLPFIGTGIGVTYRPGRMEHSDLGDLGTLSILSDLH